MNYTPTDPWLSPFLRRVKERPGSYLGHESARELLRYLQGYRQARADLGLPEYPEPDTDLLEDFEKWIKHRYGRENSTVSWCDIIESIDHSDRNIRVFFRELDVFLDLTGRDLDSIGGSWPPGWNAD